MADAGLAVSMIEEGMKIVKKYKNLIIIGNGFDRWQNLPTSYENFRLYYQDHITSAAEALGCSFYTVTDKIGKEQKLTAVELIYGDILNPEKPFSELIEHRFIRSEDPKKGVPRLEGLYAVEKALYETDKHVVDCMDDLCVAFMENGGHMEDIENIYVLGYSFAPAESL